MATDLAIVGTWDLGKSRHEPAFLVCSRDVSTGTLRPLHTALPNVSVGQACIDPRRSILYCVDEDVRHEPHLRGGGGRVMALKISPETGKLTEVDQTASYGTLPSYVAVDATGDYLLVTNHTTAVPVTRITGDAGRGFAVELVYDDATTVLYGLGEDGEIEGPLDVLVHTGRGERPAQTHPQMHSVVMAPSGTFFVVADKGADRVLTVGIDRANRSLRVLGEYPAPPGTSPRYSAFHPDLPYLFVNHEAEPLVSSHRYTDDGELDLIGITPAVAPDVAIPAGTRPSDLRVHPSGRHVYCLLRGMNAITVFGVDESSGSLTPISTVDAGGRSPRGCALSPDGRFLYVAASESDEVIVWVVGDDGLLAHESHRITTPTPGSVTLWPGQSPRPSTR